MSETLRISLAQPVSTLCVLEASSRAGAIPNRSNWSDDPVQEPATTESSPGLEEVEQQKRELAQLCETVNSLAGKLDHLYQQTVVHNHGDIAGLAVEIARKIVMCEIGKGRYDIQAIVEEALKRVPTHQDLAVRVNPQDAPLCQRLQEASPDSPFAKLQFVADGSIPPANCLIETPKGIVRSFVEEGLERIREALEKSQ